ncbi:alkane 1-monooxygenase [Polaribacter aestuariivivens]|uniref:Alkane 1-monooxygenase n=1 Tax=Polaribacter aestuariivivens TaxID=2304626 RepID=A0A5S3NCG9_9FLAO|nr:alkane 1-monooxygenase [Polaribacter aestuariivivens]TMM32214.1 alkane 1-monooxygenase [Polaribacter aestuariivivens]
MKAIKYFSVLLIPFANYISFTNYGWLTFLPVLFVFGFVPLLEFFIKPNKNNFTKEEEKTEKQNKLYTYLLYLILPIQIVFLIFFFNSIQNPVLETYEIIGRILGMGIMCGVLGINVGHELGHRNNRFDEFIGELLLLTSLNTHFLPYHNGGHHYNVATPKDAATARKNEWIFIFWIRSHFSSYTTAWSLENTRMKTANKTWFHHKNRMIVYTISTFFLISIIFFFYGKFIGISFILAAIVGILLLETVNYIEHYGLLRKQNENGRYERVKRNHSWNSDHQVGQVLLFNLSRHSDHHYNGAKHYQLLKSVPESPQMPTGYPGMMLLSLIPPIWFLVMNKKLKKLS